jgi:hypothetical protein
LRTLFDRSGAQQIVFDFAPTAKNGPLRQFLASITRDEPERRVTITRSQFAITCPPLYHNIEERRPSTDPWTQSQPA